MAPEDIRTDETALEAAAEAEWLRCRSLAERKSGATWDEQTPEVKAAWRGAAQNCVCAYLSALTTATEPCDAMNYVHEAHGRCPGVSLADKDAVNRAAQAIMEVEGWLTFNAETIALMWETAKRDARAALGAVAVPGSSLSGLAQRAFRDMAEEFLRTVTPPDENDDE